MIVSQHVGQIGVITQQTAPRGVRVSGNRDQGRPESGGYRYGHAKPWAIRALLRSARASSGAENTV